MRRRTGSRLGAKGAGATVPIILFAPSVDRDELPIDQEYWREEALRVFGRLFGGATLFPQGRGVWRDDARGGSLVFDSPSILFCRAEEKP